MKQSILNAVANGIRAVETLQTPKALSFIQSAADIIVECYRKKGKLLIAGNGGSLCDAMHFAEELTGYFRQKRKALPAIAICEPGHLTCVANDAGYEYVFSRAVEAYGKPEDVFIALTTSGNSINLLSAIRAAKKLEMKTIAFLGKTGGEIKGLGDLEWVVEGFTTSDRVQEAHMCAIHIIIEMVEKKFLGSEKLLKKMRAVAAHP